MSEIHKLKNCVVDEDDDITTIVYKSVMIVIYDDSKARDITVSMRRSAKCGDGHPHIVSDGVVHPYREDE